MPIARINTNAGTPRNNCRILSHCLPPFLSSRRAHCISPATQQIYHFVPNSSSWRLLGKAARKPYHLQVPHPRNYLKSLSVGRASVDFVLGKNVVEAAAHQSVDGAVGLGGENL